MAEHTPLAQLDDALRERIRQDPALGRLLALAAAWLRDLVDRAEGDRAGAETLATPAPTLPDVPGQPIPMQAPLAAPPTENAEPPAAAPEPSADPGQIAALVNRFSGGSVSPVVRGHPHPPAPASAPAPRRPIESLAAYARRLELKADACAWAVRRHDAAATGHGFTPVKPEYDSLRARADTMQPCYLWMIHSDSNFIDSEAWLRLEGCYRACAEALTLVVEFPDAYEASADLLRVVGEAQSAIRAGMSACGAHPRWTDLDQQYVFDWCRDEGEARRIYNRFLALDHLADPSLHAGLLARTRRLREELTTQREAAKKRRRGLNTVRYHLGQLADGDDTSHHWQRIGDGVEEILDAGVQPSAPELTEILLGVADSIPASLYERPGIGLVLRYVDERIAANERSAGPIADRREPTREMLLVRNALRGKRLVLIGGIPRPHAKELIEREFELNELDWLNSREHQSISTFEPAIARPETFLVAIMIRWSSHSYEGVQEACEKFGKIFVRLPGGYNPSQVAHQLLEQASEQLGIPNA